MSIHMSMHRSIHMSMHLSIHMSVHMSIHMSMHMSIHMSMQMSIHKSMHRLPMVAIPNTPTATCHSKLQYDSIDQTREEEGGEGG